MDLTKQTATPQSMAPAPEPVCTEDPLGVVGKVIGGKYEIHEHLGAGGFGEVYAAVNTNLRDQRLVVKFFKRIQARDKFDKEARILCKLDHPNISRVVDYLPGDSAIVIHRIDGQDAESILWESGPLEADLLLSVARTMADAVAYAHSQGIAHRDLKPSNILIDRHRHIYLIDFGIAKEVGGTATKTGRVALTPNFAAPERHAGIQSYNPFLSDVYELGVSLFNLATRSLPYHNPASPALSEWRSNAGRSLDPAFRRVLKKAMDPDPAARYASAEAMALDLSRVRRAYARPVRRVFIGAAVATVFLAVLAVLGGRLREHRAARLAQEAADRAPLSAVEPGAALPPPAALALDNESTPGTANESETAPSTSSDQVAEGNRTEPGRSAGHPGTGNAASTGRNRVAAEAAANARPNEKNGRAKTPRGDAPQRATEVSARQTLQVSPVSAHTRAWVDGSPVRLDAPIDLVPGRHTVTVAHPDYPLFTQPVDVEAGRAATFRFDLAAAFAGRETARVQLALVPPTDSHLLQVRLNGRAHNFSRFPALDFSVPSGEWLAAFQVQPLNSAADDPPRVDSCLYFAGGERTATVLRGESGRLALGAGRGRLLIFWSQE